MHTYVTLEPQAEEIAFLEGSNREKEILNEQLGRVTAFNSTFFSKQFKQGIIDQYFLKYMASMIGWPVRSVRARSERIPFHHFLENHSNTSISFVKIYKTSELT